MAFLLSVLAGQSPILAQVKQVSIFERVTISPRFSPDPMILRGVSGGSVSAASIARMSETSLGPCAGFVDREPDHILTLRSFFTYLSLEVESSEDTTLVIQGPGGTWCNDDYRNMNPGIAGQWLAGEYHVWVGSYKRGEYYPYAIRLTAAPLLNPVPYGR